MNDLINRADAIEAVMAEGRKVYTSEYANAERIIHEADAVEALAMLPSAEAEGEDLVIKGAKGIQDGLYNIKDGKLYKYKANGGTVRTYPIVPSADAVQG